IAGNCALLARALDLTPNGRFGQYDGVDIGVAGECDLLTSTVLARADSFARPLGGSARASLFDVGRRTKRWAIITGAGGGSREIDEARTRGIDTLIVGEGPHHATVSAPDAGIVVIFAGHYATETVGVRAIAEMAGKHFSLPHKFLLVPTGS
ncbi:MAG: Nif3-like dinuclear metal center hexameric protein, partial [Gemmatimonadaceae bacterium]